MSLLTTFSNGDLVPSLLSPLVVSMIRPGGIPAALAAALAGVETSPVDIMTIGTSVTEGANVTTTEERWIERTLTGIRNRFQPAEIPGGVGYRPVFYASPSIPDAWTTEAGTVANNSNWGPGFRAVTLDSTDAIELDFTGTGFAILYASAASGGTFSVSIDGGVAENVSTAAATQDARMWTSDPLSSGAHAVRLTAVSGASVVTGAMVFDGDETAGIRLWDAGHSGYNTNNFTTSLSGQAITRVGWQFAAIQPDLVIIALVLNDYGLGVSVATTKTNLQSLITSVRANAGDASILLVVDYQRGGSFSPVADYDDYAVACAELAASNAGVRVCDLRPIFGDPADAETAGLLSSDQLHPTALGHATYSDAILAALGMT